MKLQKCFLSSVAFSSVKTSRMEPEVLCLQWNEFQTNLRSSFKDLRNSVDFSDVTLVCEDQKQILAHKVVLSSGSSFFKSIFSVNPHPRPLLYLRVKFSDLQAIVRFVYTGQCKVGRDELDRFLEIANNLEIVGIANEEDIKVSELPNHDDLENANDEADAKVISESVFENLNEQTDVERACGNNIKGKNNDTTREEERDNLNGIKREPKEKTGISCNECKQIFATQSDLTEHMSKEHLSYGYQIFSADKSLSSHKKVQNTKKTDPWLRLETEEQLTFFGRGQKDTKAYDKDFHSFGYVLGFDPIKELPI